MDWTVRESTNMCSSRTRTTASLAAMFSVIFLVLTSFGVTRTMGASSPVYTPEMFTDPLCERLNHMVVDSNTGMVYMGGVNRLYQLSPDLRVQVVEVTGPQEDSPECPVSRECPLVTKHITSNNNKALVIDYTKGKLISCGSLFQGMCNVHQLHNISRTDPSINEAVVANNATASTVAFIAPGPPNPPMTHVLYVGVTHTGNGPYRTDVPAVSSRSLDPNNMFSISAVSVTTGTRQIISPIAKASYYINYVYGFSSKGYSYFLTTQKQSTLTSTNRYISKIVRICQKDQDYYSYTEIPIECKNESTDYNLVQAAYIGRPGSELATTLGITAQDEVLYVVFSQSLDQQDIYDKPSDRSALCVYSVMDIHRKFTQNIQQCFQGKTERGLDFIIPSVPCIHTQLPIPDDFCGVDVNYPIGGELPAHAVPVLTYPGTRLTAVAATSTHDYTIAFLGTSNGHLKKVAVESSKTAFEFSDVVVDDSSPINSDLLFDHDKQHLYVMSERKVTRLKVQECSFYQTCGECLGARDPYCGWCSLDNKCSVRSACTQAARDPLYWLPYKSGKCTTITTAQPHQIQRTTARTLMLTIDNLPTLQGQFQCAFTALSVSTKQLVTNASRTAQGVSCPTPRTDALPPIPAGQHHFTATLSVRVQNGPDFVATNFTFYDCSTYSSCTQCVSSPFPCDWCVEGHRCTHDTGENCRNDILVTGVNNFGPSVRSGPGFCPRINTTNGGVTEILVPANIRKTIQVKVDNIAQFIVQTRFMCQFNIEGRMAHVGATLIADTIMCEEMIFDYTSRSPNTTASFAVIWAGSKPLDNPDDIHVLVYRCQDMADNCGMCLALSEKYGCGWCQSSSTCEVTEQCDGGLSAWLDRQKTCPNPEIRTFDPMSGPYEGGTRVTINGINLGKWFDDIRNGVSVAGIQCIPTEAEYKRTSRIVCELGSTGLAAESTRSGPIIVRVADFRGESGSHFHFVDPKIQSVHPIKGPISGGTKLTIRGEHMNAGSTIRAYIDSSPCEIIKTTSTYAECVTSNASSKGDKELRMTFDRGERKMTNMKYSYVTDPEIQSVESGSAVHREAPKGVLSGGIKLTVKGSNLDAVLNPQIYVELLNGKQFISPCTIQTAGDMYCDSPDVLKDELADISFDADNPLALNYGFLMDNAPQPRLLVSRYQFKKFLLYPNPVYHQFEEVNNVKYYKSDYLTINGDNLDRACQESDVEVYIGTAQCNVTSLSRSQLTCRPPTNQPTARGSTSSERNRAPEVEVIVGKKLKFQIGRLSYESPIIPDGALSVPVIVGVALAGGFLLIVVVCILIAYKRKSSESSRVLKNMQEQMDVLELRVAAECKEAFAELQTEMTDMTGDLTSGGIPFLDYRSYTMKILFPSIEDHAVLRDLEIEGQRKVQVEKGLRLFGQLMMSKTFLLLFIRTLEANRYFSMRDRVNVASLIMIALQGKMEYCTDILKTQLAELIEKCIEGKSHPKLLLRRTESVAEKMLSAWFTFLLYKFLKECAGEPLYMLYRAIKQQVDKGPVDAITSEARYSLSEEKLIRQSIDYKPLTVYVSMHPQTIYTQIQGLDGNIHDTTTDMPVKVLCCDTVSQIKEKALDQIYRATPFSQRPSKEDLDLEWRTGMSGRLILSDEDTTTKPEGDWRKINTLAHYKVPDGALLTLVPKQSSMYNLSIFSEKSEKSHKYETLNFHKLTSSPPMSRATSPLNHDTESGYKYWHLVKHHDNDAHKEGERGNKMVSEIYLTRLLATKGTLQKFVDDLFETIFSTAHRGSALPLAIKYMFDFLDDQALQHGITDPEVVHTWKSNSLPLRFWVNLIKNPNFVFDAHKSNIVDSCLSVVAQTFMDSCSKSDHRLGKDSPSSKLLYAKDIPIYKEWVERYYQDIKIMPAISDQDMNAMLAEESRIHGCEFNANCALYELYMYAHKYNDQLLMTLEEDEFSKKNKLAYKLEQVHSIMAGEMDTIA